jgi:tRNA G10  N-methylase Trm11
MVFRGDSPIKAAYAWPSNAELIADCALLGYVRNTDHVLDPTFGRGVWWKLFRPYSLTTHNRNEDGVDFRNLPHDTGVFDVVAYDPPYVSVGGRESSGIKEMHGRYGMEDAPNSPAALQDLINEGLHEVHRVLKPRGVALVKCQDYISSGKLWLGTHRTLTYALDELGFTCVDRLEHITSPRPQPANRRQVHARRNLSTLFVLRKAKS